MLIKNVLSQYLFYTDSQAYDSTDLGHVEEDTVEDQKLQISHGFFLTTFLQGAWPWVFSFSLPLKEGIGISCSLSERQPSPVA